MTTSHSTQARPTMPEIPDNREADLLGLEHARDADLVLFMAGNQFMAMPDLLSAFRARHPHARRIYCETLPPRLECDQILAGGAVFRGDVLDMVPDVYTSVSGASMRELGDAGLLAGEPFVYLRNRLAILVAAGNPLGIMSVVDLGREHVRISEPNRRYEDIAAHIEDMYRAAGGKELAKRILEDKVADGSTLLTTVHHRETPERILSGAADAGPVWATEVRAARAAGWALEGVDVGEALDQREHIAYYACGIRGGAHPENGRAFLDFLRSDAARAVYTAHGFTPA